MATQPARFALAGLAVGAVTATACAALAPLVVLRLAKVRRMRSAYLRSNSPPSRCRLCAGSGRRVCQVCAGRGALPPGGFARRNTVRMASLKGSQWTSVEAIDGKWRHFVVTAVCGSSTKKATVTLSSTCGPTAKRISLEVPVRQLRERTQWAGGWTTLSDIEANGALPTPSTCSACGGLCQVPCPRCDGLGQVGL